jgi:hypothetical protein
MQILDYDARHRPADTAGTHNSRFAMEKKTRASPLGMTGNLKYATSKDYPSRNSSANDRAV